MVFCFYFWVTALVTPDRNWNDRYSFGVPFASVNNVELCYETAGDPNGPPLLLVAGLASQLIHWPEYFVQPLVDAGYFVIRFDNRDIGLSTIFDGEPHDPTVVIEALAAGEEPDVAYTLTDMALDTAGLLDHLNVDAAHVVGLSMGAMIGQQLAIDFPSKVLSLTSIMSTAGTEAGAPTEKALGGLLSAPEEDTSEGRVAHNLQIAKLWASPGHYDAVRLRTLFEDTLERSGGAQSESSGRHICAVMASGSRAEALGKISTPTLVVHGTADELITFSGGELTAASIPDAEFLVIEGMGHDLVPAFVPRIIDAITGLVTKAQPA